MDNESKNDAYIGAITDLNEELDKWENKYLQLYGKNLFLIQLVHKMEGSIKILREMVKYEQGKKKKISGDVIDDLITELPMASGEKKYRKDKADFFMSYYSRKQSKMMPKEEE